jgi:hypothetical protein
MPSERLVDFFLPSLAGSFFTLAGVFFAFSLDFFDELVTTLLLLTGERRAGDEVSDLAVPAVLLLRVRSLIKMLAISSSIGSGVGVLVDSGETSGSGSSFFGALDAADCWGC